MGSSQSTQSNSAKKNRQAKSQKGDGTVRGRTESGRRQTQAVTPISNDSGYAGSVTEEMRSEARRLEEESSESSYSWERPSLASLRSLDMAKLRISETHHSWKTPTDLRNYSQSSQTLPNPRVHTRERNNLWRSMELMSERSHSVPPKSELSKQWRKFDWRQKEELLHRLQTFSPYNPNVTNIKILVAGQVGAGKSSFINSVNSAFQGQVVCEALADATSGESHSFTQRLESFRIRNADRDLPFEIFDVMGLEPETLSGCHTEDIIATIYGHVKDGYEFKHRNPLSQGDGYFIKDPSLTDKAFCLVYVIDASTVQFTDEKLIEKLRIIRNRISEEGIPQVIVMTKVDEACPLVKDDLKKIYTSKKIKEKMEMCSGNIGVPMNCIFPVKNYSDEIDTDEDVDVLILKAFDQIVRSANARLRKSTSN